MTGSRATLQRPALPHITQLLIRESKALDQQLTILGRSVRPDGTAKTPAQAVTALHQLRVHTRRVRTLLWAMRPELSRKTYKLRNRYRSAIKTTNALRDQQVLTGRVQNWQHHADSNTAPACHWLLQRTRRQTVTVPYTDSEWLQHFHQLNQRLRQRLSGLHNHAANSPNVAQLLQRPIRQLQYELSERFLAITQDDIEALHALRITIKQLRYSLHPWRQTSPLLSALLKTLKHAQNLLGHIHDNRVQKDWLKPLVLESANEFYSTQLALIDANPAKTQIHTTDTPPGTNTPPGAALPVMDGLLALIDCLNQEYDLMRQATYPILKQELQPLLQTALEQLIEQLKLNN